MKDSPYISPKLDVRTTPNLTDRGLRETAEFYLATPIEECELSSRDFGVIVKKPNCFQKPITRLFCFHNYESGEGFELDDKELAIDRNIQYVFSEILLCLSPNASTTMMSHEGELFEVAEVVGPENLIYRTACSPGTNKVNQSFQKGESFFAVRPAHGYRLGQKSEKPLGELFEGFYHRIENPRSVINLSHIVLVAEKEMAVKDGVLMRYGINRPPNTWVE
jgi:hypothetical protein